MMCVCCRVGGVCIHEVGWCVREGSVRARGCVVSMLHRTTKESWNETEWRSNSELKVTVEEHSKRQRRELQTLDQSFAGSN